MNVPNESHIKVDALLEVAEKHLLRSAALVNFLRDAIAKRNAAQFHAASYCLSESFQIVDATMRAAKAEINGPPQPKAGDLALPMRTEMIQ